MNPQAIAILNGAIAQLQALEQSQQGQIDADTSDVSAQQQAADDAATAAAAAIAAQQKVADDAKAAADAQIVSDQADIVMQTNDLANTGSVIASLQSLIVAVPA